MGHGGLGHSQGEWKIPGSEEKKKLWCGEKREKEEKIIKIHFLLFDIVGMVVISELSVREAEGRNC